MSEVQREVRGAAMIKPAEDSSVGSTHMCEDDLLALLHGACRTSSVENVRRVLNQGVNVNACITGSDVRVFSHAAYGGNADICRLLIEYGADIEFEKSDENSPLTVAASQGHESLCELLIAKGADPNSYASNGRLALTQAAWKGYAKICALLIGSGADINLCDRSEGAFPLLNATYEQSDDGEGSFITCSLLLNAGANIDQSDGTGLTTLMDVASKGDIEICCLLLSRGADIDISNAAGETASDMALSARHPEIAMLLNICRQGDSQGRSRAGSILDCAKLIATLPERFDDYFRNLDVASTIIDTVHHENAGSSTVQHLESGDPNATYSSAEFGDDKDLADFDRYIAERPHQRWDGSVRPSSRRFRDRLLRPSTSEDRHPCFVPSLFVAFAVSSPNVLRDVERVFWFGLILNRPLPGRRRPPLAVEVL